ncbi:MAG: class I SAM-dependent methyltransferase [Undibacterium sp.]|uniref:class I SAM-dependent methyltransferase n=1 Tax=Undibacterium sp. TaxID=1914977 RepID=UPI0027235885|nr:class I SAM-dependent methyltransferase [Undibacterium sp.]MDO8651969.1 class I SAM-dependent methyltransferase [Undibacterium sp.]
MTILQKKESPPILGTFDIDVFDSYQHSPYLSIKHSSYFQVYEELLNTYRNKPITFVEVGVLNGGSLFMWRDYFGSQARIIGIDFNPLAKRWEKEGFEIFIGNQADPLFWKELFAKIGPIDVLLDDGGHTNEQQIITTFACIPMIKDGGMLIVEDVHASYMRQFSNPSKYSFIEYCKYLVDVINARFPKINALTNPLKEMVYSICFFESIVSFKIDRRKCFHSSPTSNGGISLDAQDFRQHATRSRGLAAKLRTWRLRRFFQR